MNTRTLFLALSATLLLVTGCQKEDRIIPNCANLFYGIYSPSGQIKEVSTNTSGENETLFVTQWIGRRLIAIEYADTSNESNTIVSQYNYDSHNRLASVDSNIIYTYNSDKLLASIKIIRSGRTRSLLFRYNGQLQPYLVIDSSFYHESANPAEWFSASIAYNLEWDKGNLIKATPINADMVRYEYIYDDNHNPFCGLAWSPVLEQEDLLQHPSFFSLNNIKDVIGYNPDGSINYYCHYGYELYNTWPQVIYKSVGLNNNSPQTVNISYR